MGCETSCGDNFFNRLCHSVYKIGQKYTALESQQENYLLLQELHTKAKEENNFVQVKGSELEDLERRAELNQVMLEGTGLKNDIFLNLSILFVVAIFGFTIRNILSL